MNAKSALVTLALTGVAAAQAQTQTLTQAQALTRLFSAPEIKMEWFAPSLLATAPEINIRQWVAGIRLNYATFLGLQQQSSHIRLVFQRGTLETSKLTLDAEGRFTDLELVPVQTFTVENALSRVFRASSIDTAWFAPELLAQVPLATIEAQLRALSKQYGPFVRLATLQGTPQVIYQRGSVLVTSAALDSQGRLTSFGAVPGPNPNKLTPQQAQVGTETLQRLLKTDPLDTSLFAPAFLGQISAAEVSGLFSRFRAQLGTVQSVSATDNDWVIHFSGGELEVLNLLLDDQGKITNLRTGAPLPRYADLNAAKAAYQALPGQVSLLVQPLEQAPAVTLNAGRLLGIGSAFKLAVLGELQAQVGAGKLKWTDQLTLTDAQKSLPSGTLQDAPAGSHYTLQELSERMIRDSDNTAADLLLGLVGRAGVEARLGQSAMPSTHEFFALKNPANAGLLRAYRAAFLNPAARREVLAQAGGSPLPQPAIFASGKTVDRDVEWYASTSRLCRLLGDVAALPATQLNPGVASKDDFARLSFKGGSEPGVLNLTTQLTNKAGKSYCVSATWNNAAPLDESRFYGMYAGVLNLLK